MPRSKTVDDSSDWLINQLGDPTLPGQFVSELPSSFCPLSVNNVPELPGRRFFWFPQGVPSGESVFLASSRLDQKLEDKPGWFDALRTFACRINPEEYFLITANGVASDEFVTRIAALFKIPLVRFKPFRDDVDADWMRATAEEKHDEFRCYYSTHCQANSGNKKSQSCKDFLLVFAARQVRILACRKSGITMKAVLARLANGLDTRIVVADELTPRTTLNQILSSGATAWLLLNNPDDPEFSSPRPTDVPILGLDEIPLNQYLLHWTRRCVGKWPDQSKSEYLDDLIFGASRAKHDPLAALCRILATDRIMASNSLTRDPTPVVCFSHVGLDQLHEMKIFRPHLSRWDFLPYGIAVEKSTLESIGTRQVVYGSQSDWNSLSLTERPYFQIERSESGKIDWRKEREWRLKGDLDLRSIGSDQALVFVPTEQDAETVANLSRWPVVVLSPTSATNHK